MLINAGSRTDIPAYFSEWFFNRIDEGFVYVRNPYFQNQVTKYILSPDVVDCIIFCTKNPSPMLNNLDKLSPYGQLWFVTITPYGKDIEPNVPLKEEVVESFKRLSDAIGAKQVVWRYDPIFINEKYSLDFHIEAFERMAESLSGYTSECVISFIDLYEKTKRNFPSVKLVSENDRQKIGKTFSVIGREHNILIKTCAEGSDLSVYGIDHCGCITKPVIERAIGKSLKIPKLSKARGECDCLLGNDIGAYNTCSHGCKYCYANYDKGVVKNNLKLHDKKSPFLIGGFKEGDIIKIAKQETYVNPQLGLGF